MKTTFLILVLALLLSNCSTPDIQPTNNKYSWIFKSGVVSGSFNTEGNSDLMTVTSGEFIIDTEKFIINEQIPITKQELRLEHNDNLLVFSNPRFNQGYTTITCEAYVYDTDNGPLKYVADIVLIARK